MGDIPPEGLPLALDISIADMTDILDDGEDTPLVLSPLRGDLLLRKRADGRLSVKGTFKVTTEIICDRCLADTPTELSGSVNELLDLVEEGAKSAVDEESDSDGELDVADGRVDLSGLLGEWFWVAWPLHFLCKPDCAGLCQRCGADFNDGPCGCAPETEN